MFLSSRYTFQDIIPCSQQALDLLHSLHSLTPPRPNTDRSKHTRSSTPAPSSLNINRLTTKDSGTTTTSSDALCESSAGDSSTAAVSDCVCERERKSEGERERGREEWGGVGGWRRGKGGGVQVLNGLVSWCVRVRAREACVCACATACACGEREREREREKRLRAVQ